MATRRNAVTPQHDDPEAQLAAKVAAQQAPTALDLEPMDSDATDTQEGVSTSLLMAPRTDVGLAPYRDLSEDFDSKDVQLPAIRIAQFMSKVVTGGLVQPGHFYLNVGNEDLGESIDVIPLKAFKHRVYFKRPEAGQQGGNQLSCRSTDMVQGVGEPGIACAACPLKDWPQGGPPPVCTEAINFPVIVLPKEGEDDELVMGIMTFQRTSTKAARNWLGLAFQRGAKARPDAWAEHYYTVSLTRQTNNLGAFFVPIVSYRGRVLEATHGSATVEYAQEMCRSLQTRANTGLAEDAISQTD